MESQVVVRIEEATADLDNVDWCVRVRAKALGGSATPTRHRCRRDDGRSAFARVFHLGLAPVMDRSRFRAKLAATTDYHQVHGDVGADVARYCGALRDRISLLPGGANTKSSACPPEVSLEVSEASLQAFGLTFDDDANAQVRSNSVNVGAGNVRTADGNFQLRRATSPTLNSTSRTSLSANGRWRRCARRRCRHRQ